MNASKHNAKRTRTKNFLRKDLICFFFPCRTVNFPAVEPILNTEDSTNLHLITINNGQEERSWN